MLIEGSHECKDCHKSFDWYYQVPQHMSEVLTVHVIPKNKVGISVRSSNKDRTPINVSAYCPRYECGYPNTFDVDYKKVTISK